MLSRTGLLVVAFLMVLGTVASAQTTHYDGEHTICRVGATKAAARTAAQDAVDDALEDFEDDLDPGDLVSGVLYSPPTWDGTEYCITYTIVWIDN
jgi:hypothetical protein